MSDQKAFKISNSELVEWIVDLADHHALVIPDGRADQIERNYPTFFSTQNPHEALMRICKLKEGQEGYSASLRFQPQTNFCEVIGKYRDVWDNGKEKVGVLLVFTEQGEVDDPSSILSEAYPEKE